MNRQLGSFYEMPKEDKEKEELKRQVEELTARLDAKEKGVRAAWMNRWALMEKSYELAAKVYERRTAGTSSASDTYRNRSGQRKCHTCKIGIGQDGFRITAAHEQRRIYRRIQQATQLRV